MAEGLRLSKSTGQSRKFALPKRIFNARNRA
jgi:hypothetical protein